MQTVLITAWFLFYQPAPNAPLTALGPYDERAGCIDLRDQLHAAFPSLKMECVSKTERQAAKQAPAPAPAPDAK